jgi:hypothetical protein
VVGVGGWLQPRAFGVGYDVIGDLLLGRMAVEAVLALLACKAVMWVFALGSGTSGGVLAPLLMMGAGLGVVLGPWLPGGQPALWPLVFMAATLGGMMRAPIMSVMFALELTQDIDALLPLLIASSVAYGFTVLTMPRSILTEKISRRGHHVYREYGIDPLERHTVSEVMTREVATIDGEMPIDVALQRHFGATQRHRAYAVLAGATFVGMVDRDAIIAGSARPGVACVADLFGANVPAMALPGESCRTIATRLAVHELERLPVVSDAHSRRLVGVISRSDLVKPALAHLDEEQHVERFFTLPLAAARVRFRSLTGYDDAGDRGRR